MINIQIELDRLRQNLRFKGLSEEAVSEIVDQASVEIHSSLIDMAYDALSSLEQLGIASKAPKFAADIELQISPSDIHLDTKSGRHDYSEPSRQMLPNLLKNAKVAKDGSLYKRIPMKTKSVNPAGLIDAQRALHDINNAKREAMKDQAARSASLPMANVSAGPEMKRFFDDRRSAQVTKTQFKTASSKQSPDVSWVHPGRELDFSRDIHNANSDIDAKASLIIADIIAKHEGAF